MSRDKAEELVRRHSRRLAKQQLTWYRRFGDIRWLPGDAADLEERAAGLAGDFLSDRPPGSS